MELTEPFNVEMSRAGRVARVLWLHLTDRWYFGDFLRHAPWLPWLRATFPSATVDVATHPDYLPLLAGGDYAGLLDARLLDPAALDGYDLVVVPGPFRQVLTDVSAGIVLSTWDTGWALHVDGNLRIQGSKQEINYFHAAHPSAIIGDFAAGIALRIAFSADELAEVGSALDAVFSAGQPVVVYNPTSSNPFTRETSAPKEADNALSAAEHAVVLKRLLRLLPDHAFVVGASRKEHDENNAMVVREVARRCSDPRVRLLRDLPLRAPESLRGFAAVLGSPRVCSVVGGGTGTNTHLAACAGTFGFSVEHGADSAMIGNWLRPNDFQMGSFRWRNPSLLSGTYTLDWSRRTPDALTAFADAFTSHHALAHDDWARLFTAPGAAHLLARRFSSTWPAQPIPALSLARQVLDLMTPSARVHYSDFTDEATYLRITQDPRKAGADDDSGVDLTAIIAALDEPAVASLAAGLFADSNLHKLLRLIDVGVSVGGVR